MPKELKIILKRAIYSPQKRPTHSLAALSKLTLISRVYVVSLVVNLLLTAVSVFSTAMNLVTQVSLQRKEKIEG